MERKEMKVCKYCGCGKEWEAEKYKVYESVGDGLTVKIEYRNLPSWIIDAPRRSLERLLSICNCPCPCHFRTYDIYLEAVKEILGIGNDVL